VQYFYSPVPRRWDQGTSWRRVGGEPSLLLWLPPCSCIF